MARPAWPRLGLAVAIVLLAAAVGVTRLWRCDAPSLWEDDYLNLDRATMPLADMFAVQQWQGPADTIFDFQPPLIYALQHLCLAVDESSLAARVPSLVAGMLLPLFVWLLGRRLFGAPAAWAACLLSVFLVFPINYAQSIKFYALFLTLATASMWLLVRAVAEGDRLSWACYALAAALMGYAGYQGLPTLAVQGVYAAGTILWSGRGGGWAVRLRRLRPAVLAFCGVALALAPWLPAAFFLQAFLRDPAVDPWAGLGPGFVAKIVAEFIAPDPDLARGWVVLWLAACCLGVAAALRERRYGAVGLLSLWLGVMAVVLVGSRSHLRGMLSTRHFVLVFPVLMLLAGRGAVALGAAAGRLLGDRRAGKACLPAVAGLACLALAWPSLAAYPAYYSRIMSLDREFFQWLDETGGGGDALEFHGYKRNTRRFAARWHLPGRFAEAGSFDGPGYRRIVHIDSVYTNAAATRPRQPGLPLTEFDALFTTTRVSLAPAANRAPLVVDPGPDGVYRFADDFRGPRFYEEAYRAGNMTLDQELGLLRPARYSRPAQATWAFEAAPGQEASDIRLTVAAALYKQHPARPADSTLTVEASFDGRDWTPLGVIGQEAFPVVDGQPVTARRGFFEEIDFYHSRCRETRRSYVVPGKLAGGQRLYVRVTYAPGQVEGFLNLAGIELTAAVRREGTAAPGDTPLARQAAHLLANVRAAPWREAHDARDVGLFAFAAPGQAALADLGLPVGTPGEGERFLARHPGLAPASVLYDREGGEALFLYDTTLAEGGARLSAAFPERRLRGLADFGDGPASLRLTGNIVMPTLRLGDRTLSVPVIAPRGSVLTLTPGGAGRLYFVPDWTDPARFTEAMTHAEELAPSRRLRGELVCRGDGGCAFTYTFVSALPVRELRLKTFPQVYANPCRKCPENAARVFASIDQGKSWRPLVAETGGEECSWTPPGRYVTRRLRFDEPVTSLLLSFRMERGEQAGFLSPSWNVDGMYLEADLDARALPPLRLAGGDLNASLAEPGENDFTLTLRPGPWPLSGRTAAR
ncbi:glycosyltransferase family 39 protein [Solidesulfovibrio sp.]|uniref:glycosyltransferase family 39 protein n=1 Tax=Solidesulfovibrio sp. TaxID=2910990 RepID=UPI00262068BF|nr:glycosyltransferase family 39 protein [Solidesulfovibrio sp.]